jgi:hypothetical protein
MRRSIARRTVALTTAALAAAGGAAMTVSQPLGASAGTVYFFHGTSNDDACRDEVLAGTSQPCAFFDTTFPTSTSASGVTQTPGADGNANQSANALSVYWYGSFSGTVSGGLYLDWYWTGPPASQTFTVTVYKDPSPLIATTNVQIAQGAVTLSVGSTTPTLNHSVVPLSSSCPCPVNSKLLIQATPSTTSSGTVHYDSTMVPSDFYFGPLSSTTSSATAVAGGQAFSNYGSPPSYQTRDALQRPNAGEPSIGADWTTGKIMYMAGTQVSQLSFDGHAPPAATWKDVTPAQLANVSEDSILFTNSEFNPSTTANRTWAEDFLLTTLCNANMAFTDNDGGSGGGPTGADTNTSWTPEQCPFAEGPDHPSIGAGPYHGGAPLTATDQNEIVYYCSQDGLNAAGAECTHSENGGLTWDVPSVIFGTATSPCRSIHGHIRVAPDGTMYVPNSQCNSTKQGVAITTNNGSSYTYSVISDAATGATDPSVAADRANNVYFGYEDGLQNTHAKIAISHDGGVTWGPSFDVGTPFGIQNVAFPEVIAGDSGRAAFAFLGTTTGGDYQVQSFRGVWYMYVAFTYDGGNTWQVVNATPNDPVQRGCIDNGGVTGSTYAGCRNMLDFNDITVDKQGRVYVAYTDGCTNSTDPAITDADRTSGNPPVVHSPYDCDANPAVNDSTCGTSPNDETFSENANEYSYNDSASRGCTYGRQSAVIRQVCGQGLFAAKDPGFFDGPSCAAGPVIPEAPVSTLLVVAAGSALGMVGLVVRRRRRKTLLA